MNRPRLHPFPQSDLELREQWRMLAGFADAAVVELGAVVNVKASPYSAVGDGVVDDTDAIAAALTDALANDVPLYFPGGTYLVAGSGSSIFTVTRPIPIMGAGPHSRIMVATGVPTTRDVFVFDPADAGLSAGFALFSGLWIGGQTAGVGRYGIVFRPGAAGEIVARAGVESIWFQNLGNFGVYYDGAFSSIAGATTSWVRNCNFNGPGVGGVDMRDSVAIENCVLFASGYAVDVAFHSNVPGKFVLRGNNITAPNGVRISGGHNAPTIADNYFEPLSTFGGADNAYVNLAGSSAWPTRVPVIRDNIFAVFNALAGTPDALRIDYAEDAVVDGNYFFWDSSSTDPIAITANAKRTRITRNNGFFGPAGARRWLNSGVMSQGGSSVLCSLLTDSAAIANTTTETVYDKSYTIPANSLYVGQVIVIRQAARFSCTGTPSLTNRIRLNGVAGNIAAATAFTCVLNAANQPALQEARLTVKALGAAGTFSRSGNTSNAGVNMTDITVNTTADIVINPTAQWGAADALNTIVLTQLTVELLDPVASV